MLLQIRDYIQRFGTVSTQQLTREFKVDLAALQPMLDIWVKKGLIAACQAVAGCRSSCAKHCVTSAPVYYSSV